MMEMLYRNQDFILLFENIVPFRRIMSIVTIFTTSILSAFNDMPSLFDSTKNQLANLALITFTSPDKRDNLLGITPDQFQTTILDKFPSDQKDWDCFEFPGVSKDFWKDFISEMKKLALKLPSILFRGIASTLDPAYKEMKAHYLNCDIDNLTWRGLRPAGTVDSKLINGLYLGATAQDRKQNAQQGKGKYVPLVLGSISDFGYTGYSLVNGRYRQFGRRLEKTISKLITYAYSGNAPFLDPSFYFKVPCRDFETRKKWAEYGKYDAGRFGRYGHPLSPLTALALSTPQLEGDKSIKEDNCVISPDPNYCEEISKVVEPLILDRCVSDPDFEGLQPNYGKWTPPDADSEPLGGLIDQDRSDEYATQEMSDSYSKGPIELLSNQDSQAIRRLWEIEQDRAEFAGAQIRGDLDRQCITLYYILYGICIPLNREHPNYLSSAKDREIMQYAYLYWEQQVEKVKDLEKERTQLRTVLGLSNFETRDSRPRHCEGLYKWPETFDKPNVSNMTDIDPDELPRLAGRGIDNFSLDIMEVALQYRQNYGYPNADL